MTKKKLWLVPLMGLALGGCTYVQGLMDPSINVNADFTAYYYLGHHDFDERPKAEKEFLPFTSDNTVEGFFNGGGTSLQGDGALSFDPSQPTRGNPVASMPFRRTNRCQFTWASKTLAMVICSPTAKRL